MTFMDVVASLRGQRGQTGFEVASDLLTERLAVRTEPIEAIETAEDFMSSITFRTWPRHPFSSGFSRADAEDAELLYLDVILDVGPNSVEDIMSEERLDQAFDSFSSKECLRFAC